MCELCQNITPYSEPKCSSPDFFVNNDDGRSSVLDNNKTHSCNFDVQTNIDDRVHSYFFGDKDKGGRYQKSSFLLGQYRYKNLTLARLLDTSPHAHNPYIKKITKGLNCCSSMALVGSAEDASEARILRTSNKCRRTVCSICNNIQARKYTARFFKAYKLYKDDFEGKYFYFLTFTLKHNTTDTRMGIFLEELKAYLTQLKRSKVWKKLFPYSKKNPLSGWGTSFELTLTENGYNIHAHTFMCCPKLTKSAKKVQKWLQKKWKKITGDSTGVNFDLVKITKNDLKKTSEGQHSSAFGKVVSEVFKYTVKVGDHKKLNAHKADQLGNWLIATKGKNMINANGFFRKMQLFGRRSNLDKIGKKEREEPFTLNIPHYVGRTVDIDFNYSHKKTRTKKKRKQILKDVYLKKITNFYNVTNIVEAILPYFAISINAQDIDELLGGWVSHWREKNNKFWNAVLEAEKRKPIKKAVLPTQGNLFGKMQT